MKFTIEHIYTNKVVIKISGEIGEKEAIEITNQIRALIDQGFTRIGLNGSEMVFSNSQPNPLNFFRTLFEIQNDLKKKGGVLIIFVPSWTMVAEKNEFNLTLPNNSRVLDFQSDEYLAVLIL